MSESKTAIFIKDMPSERHTVWQKLYKLLEPMTEDSWGDSIQADYVIVSAANVFMSGPETYIFRSDENGKVLGWTELPGSFRGALDHERALINAGYTVFIPEEEPAALESAVGQDAPRLRPSTAPHLQHPALPSS